MIRLNPKANWVEFRHPHPTGLPKEKWYRWGEVSACVSQDPGVGWHVSISHPRRYPTWDEIYTAWYDLVPDTEHVQGAIFLPRRAEYVNMHPNCFHVHQV